MKRTTRLDLRKETLGELTTAELAGVQAGTGPRTLAEKVKQLTTVLSGGVGCQSCCSCTAVSDTVDRD